MRETKSDILVPRRHEKLVNGTNEGLMPIDNPNVFFEVVRPIFGKLSQNVVDQFNYLFATWPTGHPVQIMAYSMATVFHETAATMMPITEYGPKSYFDKYEPGTPIGNELGNTQPGDGYKYRGRGYVMITGRANYTKASEKLNEDFVNYPDLALEPPLARAIMRRGCLEGWFTGKKFQDYINPTLCDYYNARRVVNGTDKAELIRDYAHRFEGAIYRGMDKLAGGPPA
jgi:hypothetical protein